MSFSLQTTISDLVQIPPHAFNDNQITRNDLEDRINEKYSNRVGDMHEQAQHQLTSTFYLGNSQGWTVYMYVRSAQGV